MWSLVDEAIPLKPRKVKKTKKAREKEDSVEKSIELMPLVDVESQTSAPVAKEMPSEPTLEELTLSAPDEHVTSLTDQREEICHVVDEEIPSHVSDSMSIPIEGNSSREVT